MYNKRRLSTLRKNKNPQTSLNSQTHTTVLEQSILRSLVIKVEKHEDSIIEYTYTSSKKALYCAKNTTRMRRITSGLCGSIRESTNDKEKERRTYGRKKDGPGSRRRPDMSVNAWEQAGEEDTYYHRRR